MIDLADHIFISEFHSTGIYKCRVLYRETIERIELRAYQLRPISTIKLVYHDTIDYSYKYEDRSMLSQLYGQRGDADDILIIKNGLVTDSYYANVAFRKDDGEWISPVTPLLKGTKRQLLIDSGLIRSKVISVEEIPQFTEVSLFNSMIELGEIRVPIQELLES